ncbi:MAG TPA: histidine kinase [Parafilimonas sp.]
MSFIFFLPGLMVLVYVTIYIFIPAFIFRKKYLLFILAVACLLILNVYCDYFISALTNNLFNTSKDGETMFLNIWKRAFIKGFQNGVTVAGIAISIKLAKYWYIKQLQNKKLAELQISNEKKILKANIRPDFILYSLNNLRKKIETSYSASAEMILHLSDLFSFILYDCKDELIPLSKEISAVQNLIEVEKIIQNKYVEIDTSINVANGYTLIPPLLLFSFLQKLFAENEIKNNKFNKICIDIDAVDGTLYLTIILNYFEKITIDFIQTEKLDDTEKKLYALYNKFEIIRNENENNYTIHISTFLYEEKKVAV